MLGSHYGPGCQDDDNWHPQAHGGYGGGDDDGAPPLGDDDAVDAVDGDIDVEEDGEGDEGNEGKDAGEPAARVNLIAVVRSEFHALRTKPLDDIPNAVHARLKEVEKFVRKYNRKGYTLSNAHHVTPHPTTSPHMTPHEITSHLITSHHITPFT